jgi:hypothetical protein
MIDDDFYFNINKIKIYLLFNVNLSDLVVWLTYRIENTVVELHEHTVAEPARDVEHKSASHAPLFNPTHCIATLSLFAQLAGIVFIITHISVI